MGKYSNRVEAVWEEAEECDCGDDDCKPQCHRLCAICGGTILYGSHESEESQRTSCGAWNIDHIIPKSRGGSNNLDNCRAVHITCNRNKANH